MAAPTKAELEVLAQFRKKVSDLNLEKATDLYMLRWLRARDLNLAASEDLLRRHLQWSKDENLDQVLEWAPPPSFLKDYSYQFTGRDTQGHPILVVPFGEWDVRKIINDGKEMRHAWLRNIDQMFARMFVKMEEISKEVGHEVTQCVLIVDFAGFSMRQLTSIANVGTILEAVKRFEANYPEILFSFYFVNAFRVFQMFFSMMKPLLSARTIAKLEIYTTPDKWVPVLKSRLPPDQLPVEFGGTCAGRRVSIGKEISTNQMTIDESDMVTVGIAAGESCKLAFEVVKPKTILSWTFKTEAHDISFSVHLKGKEVVKSKRYEANLVPVTGAFTCDVPGDYVLKFDNSYSRLRGKTVLYNVEVIEPEANGKSPATH